MEQQYALNHTIFETVTGSQAYGTNTPESDEDRTGVMIPGPEYFLGFKNVEEFSDFGGVDRKIYAIHKATSLLLENNPNMLDLLWAPDRCIKKTSPWWERILLSREKFLSKKCRYTFSGYAIAQLNRIKVHRKFLLDPPKSFPTRTEMGLPEQSLFPTSQLKAVCYAAIEAIPEDLRHDFLVELDQIYGDWVIPLFARFLDPDQRKLSLEWLQMGISAQAHAFQALGTKYLKEEYYDMASKEVVYLNKKTEWEQYQNWSKSRNKKRAALEEKFGFDCYADDTEFLTDSGWKKYRDVSIEDRLATVRGILHKKYLFQSKRLTGKPGRYKESGRRGQLEYQHFVDRFEGTFTGSMYQLTGNHIDVRVTPNHRMLFKPVSRKNRISSDFVLEEISCLPECFEVLATIDPATKTYGTINNFPDVKLTRRQYLSLMGWYLSDGCLGKCKSNPKNVRISQKSGGRLHWHMSRFHGSTEAPTGLYSYERGPNLFRSTSIQEIVLIVYGKELAQRFLSDCGEKTTKKIPRWVFGLSKHEKEILFDAMVLGDGTIRNTSKKSVIYYTSVKSLADDVQELAVTCGWETSLYGPYDSDNEHYPKAKMFHVHIDKNSQKHHRIMRRCAVRKIPVVGQNIVCFSVPNGVLVTRRNGHVAFHGNSKHAMHLVRLCRMGAEILEAGKVNVDRTNIDAEELKSIRDGAWSYDKVEQYAHDMDKQLGELYKASKLPHSPDREYVEDVIYQVITDYHSSKV